MKTMEQLKSQMNPNMTLDEFFQPDVVYDFVKELVDEFSWRKKPVGVVLLYDKDSSITASTNGERIRINLATNQMQRQNTFEERYNVLVGLAAHELGHILFDETNRSYYFVRNILKGKLWPVNFPNLEMHSQYGENALKMMSKEIEGYPVMRKAMYMLYNKITNIFEDGYVNRRMSECFPDTLKPCIDYIQSDSNKWAAGLALEKYDYLSVLNGLFSFYTDVPSRVNPGAEDCLNAAYEEYKCYGLPDDDMQRNKLYGAVTVCVYPQFKKFLHECLKMMKEEEKLKENDNVSKAG